MTLRFNEILEMVKTLSTEEQTDLMNIVRYRQLERRRQKIATNIADSKVEYQEGNVFRGTVEEIMNELMK